MGTVIASDKAAASRSRRAFFSNAVQGAGLALIGGALWGAHLQTTQATTLVLRPPGAMPEQDFKKACIKCGLCVQACRQRENRGTRKTTLKLAKVGEKPLVGTPYFLPRETPCYMCEDIPCAEACPTGALDTGRVCNTGDDTWYGADCETSELDINQARMGIAIVDENSCVAYHDWGLQCDICYRVCPLIEQAISLKFERNQRTGKHAFLVPVIDRDSCTGCGICEERCITEEAAIKVVPLALV
ncbi:MAG: ferredoxin-type protein NapG, partial [Gammaproteobacteria bacterium]|nr:ferredoxin-type protein NapG [Gammaproteobacteria bacterium]